jgi:hypothetical protein
MHIPPGLSRGGWNAEPRILGWILDLGALMRSAPPGLCWMSSTSQTITDEEVCSDLARRIDESALVRHDDGLYPISQAKLQE